MGKDNIAKISIIEGDSIEIIGGSHTEYVGKMTYSSNQKLLVTAVNGKSFGDNPEDPPKTKGRIIDIVMLVAGTTDPVNTSSKKHHANSTYWKDHQIFLDKLDKLRLRYLDVNVEHEFFSWTGKNNTQDRIAAADRLLNLFMRVYKYWKNQEVHLHLIGHSHGGNVINQFTELISTDTKFPESWKVKSITYLSTPFFQKKHQLNHSKLHKQCKIINVYNEYDLTQRFIADFTLVNLEILVKKFNKGNFDAALAKIKQTNFKVFDELNNTFGGIDNGSNMWTQTVILLQGVRMLIEAIINYIQDIKTEKLKKEQDQFIGLLTRIKNWSSLAEASFISRKKDYKRSTFFSDLHLLTILKLINELFAIKTGVTDSYLLNMLGALFKENTGITESIELNSWSPEKQTKGLSIIPVNVTQYDIYNNRKRKSNFNNFVSGIQASLVKKDLPDVLMRLFSQFIEADKIKEIREKISKLEYVISGDSDTQLKILRNVNLKNYEDLIRKYNANLVVASDKTKDIMIQPGSIPYLATVSHSLSHTQLFPEIEDGLKNAFSSGKNPKYK